MLCQRVETGCTVFALVLRCGTRGINTVIVLNTHTHTHARAQEREREREREREIVLVLCYGSRDCSIVSWWLNDPAWQTISWTSQTTVGAASPLCKFHTKFPSLITSQYTDTRPTSPSIDPIKQWQASCREATIVLNNFQL